MTTRFDGQRGDAALELALGVAVLLIPVLLLVGTVPRWVDHRHAAVVAATEAARVAAAKFPSQDVDGAIAAAREVLAAEGVSDAAVDVHIRPAVARGDTASAAVRVRMPALSIPMIGEAGAWTLTVTASRRVEDHRSR